MTDRQRVVVVTGGGAGIGAAIAESLGTTGAHVVTLDPLVTLDGSAAAEASAEPTTAERIVAAGGSARASNLSVTDADGVRTLFESLADEFGGLDAVVNVAGITRPTFFGKGTDADWLRVLQVHLDGYRNVLGAALPLMAAAGRGHVLGVTSGSGWRAADAGAYACAKRAVASLTWQLGRSAPTGVTINAISPIAATRMVAAALSRMKAASGSSTGGLSLGSMPEPEHLGPLGAHLVGASFSAAQGRVLFAGGSEIAVVDEPRIVEVVRTEGVPSVAHLVDAAATIALAPAEADQVSGGGSNARFGARFDEPVADALPASVVSSCAVVGSVPGLEAALTARGVTCVSIDDAAALVDVDDLGAVVVALPAAAAAAVAGAPGSGGWEQVLAEHEGIVGAIHADAAWVRSVRELAASSGRALRLVTVTDGTTAGGRSRAQSAAQLARAGRKATSDQVVPFSVSLESGAADSPVAELVAHLVAAADADALAGAELVAASGWLGLRSHPRPLGSISFGGPAIPAWFDDTLRQIVETR